MFSTAPVACLARRNPGRNAVAGSLPVVLPGLRLQLGKPGSSLLDVGRKVRHFMYLSNLYDFVLRTRTTRGPLDGLFLRLHLDHPVSAEHFLRLRERPVGDLWFSSSE